MIKAVIAGFSSFLLFLFLHALIFRLFDLKRRFRALTAVFFALIPVYVFIYFIIPTPFMVLAPVGAVRPAVSIEAVYKITFVLNFLSGLALYVFLFLGYCQFYFIVDRSVSVRAMIEIEESGEKRLSRDALKEVYSLEEMFERRLTHMLDGGYIRRVSGGFENTGKGRLMAKTFCFLKDFLRLGRGG